MWVLGWRGARVGGSKGCCCKRTARPLCSLDCVLESPPKSDNSSAVNPLLLSASLILSRPSAMAINKQTHSKE